MYYLCCGYVCTLCVGLVTPTPRIFTFDVVFDVHADDDPNRIFLVCEKSQNIFPNRGLDDIGEKTYQLAPYRAIYWSNVVRVNIHDTVEARRSEFPSD